MPRVKGGVKGGIAGCTAGMAEASISNVFDGIKSLVTGGAYRDEAEMLAKVACSCGAGALGGATSGSLFKTGGSGSGAVGGVVSAGVLDGCGCTGALANEIRKLPGYNDYQQGGTPPIFIDFWDWMYSTN